MAGWDDAELSRLRSNFGAQWGIAPESLGGVYAPKGNAFKSEDDDDGADAAEFAVSPTAPAALTDIPTSSINASRPRTVAAGYDKTRAVLTVVFRDGTIWNYDGVTPGEWQNFSASISKGRPWINDQLFGRGYPADMSSVNASVAAEIYRYARAAQIKYATKYSYKDSVTGKKAQRVSKTAVSRSALKPGKNPSKGGKNPNQK
jgi:hypothetical protein